MKFALITGSCGLVGSESSLFFSKKNFKILGIDNNEIKSFFGKDGDISWVKKNLKENVKNYSHFNVDIRNYKGLEKIFTKYKKNIKIIIHENSRLKKNKPFVDFDINKGILIFKLTKKYCKNAPFIFMSTNKVYGDNQIIFH